MAAVCIRSVIRKQSSFIPPRNRGGIFYALSALSGSPRYAGKARFVRFSGIACKKTIRRKVLVVDDELVNRRLLGFIAGRDYEMIYAENGQEALDLIREHERIQAAMEALRKLED